MVYVSEGCQPQNRLYYLDLGLVPTAADGALDFSKFDFFKGEALLQESSPIAADAAAFSQCGAMPSQSCSCSCFVQLRISI